MTYPSGIEAQILPLDRFTDCRDSWDSIVARSAGHPIQDHAFFLNALEAFGYPSRAVVSLVSTKGTPVAAGIFLRGRPGSLVTYQPSQAPLGAWVVDAAVDVETVLAAIVGFRPRRPLRLTLTQQDPCLFKLDPACARAEASPYIETGRIAITGSFDDYWATCSSNLRANMKKQSNRLLRDGRSMSLAAVTDPAVIADAVDEYGLLESAGWKASGGTAVHPSNPQGAFYRALLKYYAAKGEAIVFQYRMDGELVASDLCLVRNGTLYVLKTTYSEALDGISPALLMRTEIMRWLFSQSGASSIEFYGRVMEWHRRFGVEVREICHWDFYASPILRRLAVAFRRRALATPQ